jgi:5-methylcytosine-specific restriction endonuclease McrA
MNVYARDDFRCQYCGSRFTSDGLTYDHVVPKSAGGRREWRNIVSACSPCNLRKGNRTCDESGMFPLRMPKAPASLPIRGPRIDRSTAPDEWLDFIGVWSR